MFGIVLAAGLTIGAIAAVSIAEGQMYTKGAVVQTPQTHVSSSAVTANAGTVTDVTIVEQPAAVALGPAAAPAAELNQYRRSRSPPQAAIVQQVVKHSASTALQSVSAVSPIASPRPHLLPSLAARQLQPLISVVINLRFAMKGRLHHAPAGSCGAIAFAQPGGRVRLYVQ